MADAKSGEKKKKVKLPTPLKRRKQDIKKALNNKIVKSKIHTARNKFAGQTDNEGKKTLLSTLFSLIDKAAKKGVFKKNKANRLKSRLHAKA